MNASIKKRIADLEASVGKERPVMWITIDDVPLCGWTDGKRSWRGLPGESDEQLRERVLSESDSNVFFVEKPNLEETTNV